MSLSLRSSSRLSILDLSSAYTDTSRDSRSSTVALGTIPDNDEPLKKGTRSRSRDGNQKRKGSSASPSSSQHRAGRKRKNCTDVEERKRQLEADPWTLEVRSRIVKCLGCKRWIKLDQRNEYYSGLWAKHRDLCRGVKMMKGEALPKRTRRSKKKTVVPANTDSSSATSPASETGSEIKPSTDVPIVPITQSAPPPRRASLRALSNASDRTSASDSASRASPAAMSIYRHHYPPLPKPASSGYPWPQYVPYYSAPYLAYYPVAQPLTLKLPPLSSIVRQRSPSPGLTPAMEEHDIDEDDEMDDDDAERYAFAPPSQNDVCHGHGCRPRFRYSTRREIRTYFDGATLDSMAQNLSCPADEVTYRGAACLLSLKSK